MDNLWVWPVIIGVAVVLTGLVAGLIRGLEAAWKASGTGLRS
jgi:hypothetical protein